jgi:hypothetical protein
MEFNSPDFACDGRVPVSKNQHRFIISLFVNFNFTKKQKQTKFEISANLGA